MSDPGGNIEVVARRFDSNGAPLGDEFPVNVFTTGHQSPFGVAMSATGFVVTWFGEGSGGDGVFVRSVRQSRSADDQRPAGRHTPRTSKRIPAGRRNERRRRFRRRMGRRRQFDFNTVLGRRYDSAAKALGDVFPISGDELPGLFPEGRLRFRRKFRSRVDHLVRDPPRREGQLTRDAVRARLYDIGGVAGERGIPGQRDHDRCCSGGHTRPSPETARSSSPSTAASGPQRHQRPQERGPGGPGDHGRPAPRSGLRTDGRQ